MAAKSKQTLRQATLARLAQLSPKKRQAYEQYACQAVKAYVDQYQIQRLACFASFSPELSTWEMMERLQVNGCQVYLPRVEPMRQLSFRLFQTPDTLVEKWGILEPSVTAPEIEINQLDAILVPGVVFSSEGYRIGYGGGYYDRQLALYNGRTFSIVSPVQYHEQADWKIESHDIAVQDLIIVPESC